MLIAVPSDLIDTPLFGRPVDTRPIDYVILAVGCPVCNQAVVARGGTSGALSWWSPVQPMVGLLAVGILVHTLRKRLRTYRLTACPLPV